MAIGAIANSGLYSQIKSVTTKFSLTMNANNGTNWTYHRADLGVPNSAIILLTNVHQTHTASADDVYYGEFTGWGWDDDDTFKIRNYNQRTSQMTVEFAVDIIYLI